MPKQKTPKEVAYAIAPKEAGTDPRFASFKTDPRFRLPSTKHTRSKVDKRFSRMLKDDDFTVTAKVDRYGRKLKSNGKKQLLQKLYELEEEEDEQHASVAVELEVEDDEVVAKELKRLDASYDAAREGGFFSSDDDEEEDAEEFDMEDHELFPDRQVEQGGVPMGEVSSRIAVVNMDWDNIRAVDLMAVFSSFVRPGGRIVKLSVYKSEYGREREELEEMEGPPRDIFAKKMQHEDEEEDEEEETDEDDENDGEQGEEVGDPEDSADDEDAEDEKIKKDLLQADDGQEFDSGALRQYQLDRLRYYYAVVVCSDVETARYIYDTTDGTEYLSSANFFDLRFISDDVEFDETPRDECTSVPSGYRPTDFVTDALQHSKVKLTWDAEDTSRKEVIKRAFSGSRAEIGQNDLKAYLGSDSSSDEYEAPEGDGDVNASSTSKKELARQKMRAALGLPAESTTSTKSSHAGPVGNMEITFTAGLSTKPKGTSVFTNAPIPEETTAEAYIRKEKERKARRKEKAKGTREGRNPAEPENEPEQAEDLGFDDPFFATDEAEKAKAAKSARKGERAARRAAKAAEAEARDLQRAELELLMADGTDGRIERLEHFDIKEIARKEKAEKRKRSRKGKGERESKRGGMQDGFQMDVSDQRFKAVFESHEFAIDPSNPKFSGTEGMKKLLEEGRNKRKVAEREDGDREDSERRRRRM